MTDTKNLEASEPLKRHKYLLRKILAPLLTLAIAFTFSGTLFGSAEAPAPKAQVTTHASTVLKAAPTVTPSKYVRATTPFIPTTISVTGITSHARVLALRRTADNIPSTPPLTLKGETQFAFDLDQRVYAGSPAGNFLITTHTYPNPSSALGNKLLKALKKGDTITVFGKGGSYLSYRVTHRVQVPLTDQKMLAEYYKTTGTPRLALITCSGKRTSPGHWSHRTVWFAVPVTK